MREEQNAAAEFVRVHALETDVQIRFLDLVSELGELSKEILKASDYGKRASSCGTVNAGKDMEEELGDCVFSLLCLCNSLNLDAKKALEGALAKYEQRFANSGTAGSGSSHCGNRQGIGEQAE